VRNFAAVSLVAVFAASSPAQSTYTLYDPTTGTLPAAQPWLAYADNALLTGGTVSQTYVAGQGVRLTTDNPVAAGYSNYQPIGGLKNSSFPVLDRTAGYRLTWTAQVHQEAHTSTDRAGFSTILLSSDRHGVELGFWGNEVWAQNAGFTHGEGAAWNTGQATEYALTVQGDTYRLDANGGLLLSGTLRDYSSFGVPYNLPSYLFVGDDTSSASADVTLGRVTLLTPVPEPTGALVAVVGLTASAAGLRRLRRR
jgi:hypothetical protein